jgi:hypothetical protein
MKNVRILIVLSLIITSLNAVTCSKETDQKIQPVKKISLDTLTFDHSMKGWELYSWPNGNDWNYSILVGTNRIKTYEEVTTNQIIVLGKDSLKILLDKFPENENIFWVSKGWLENCWNTDYGNLSLPDDKTVNEIKDYCIQKKLVLSISE